MSSISHDQETTSSAAAEALLNRVRCPQPHPAIEMVMFGVESGLIDPSTVDPSNNAQMEQLTHRRWPG